jgi:hypothetical protein
MLTYFFISEKINFTRTYLSQEVDVLKKPNGYEHSNGTAAYPENMEQV